MVSAPGSGWFGDLATAATPVAYDAVDVAVAAAAAPSLAELTAQISVCRACPRLVAWREEAARTKRRAFADEPYWGRPVPGFGADRPCILILGLAPAAHGANRTGRNFTGDRVETIVVRSHGDPIARLDGVCFTIIRGDCGCQCAFSGHV